MQQAGAVIRPGILRNSRAQLVLAGILLVGLALRFWNLGWGLPERLDLHPDESTYVIGHALELSWHNLDPVFLNYPSFLCYATALLHGALHWTDPACPDWTAYLIGRGISATCGTLTILVVFFLARRLGGNVRGALLAAAWTALLPLHVWESHIAVTDVMMNFWLMLTLLASVRLCAEPRPRVALLAGICLGLATGSKYTAAVACLAPLVAVLLAQGISPGRRVALLAIAAAVSLAACFAVTPYSFLRFSDTLQAMAYENSHTHGHHFGFSVPANGPQYHRGVYQLVAAWPFSLGVPLYLTAIAGTAWFVFRKPGRCRWAVLAFALAFGALTCSMTFTPLRYYFPLLLLGTLFAGMWCGEELDRAPRSGRFWIMGALVLAVTLYTAAFTVSTTRRYGLDTRIAADRWLKDNLRPGQVLHIFGWHPYCGWIPEQGDTHPEIYLCHLGWTTTNDLLEVTSLDYLRNVRHGKAGVVHMYGRLRANPAFELAAFFDVPFLNRDFYGKLDPMFRTYFVAPTLEFYRRRPPEPAPAP